MVKSIKFKERIPTGLRIEFSKVFSHAQFTNPVGNFTSGSFARISSARDPRMGQLAPKVGF